MQSDLEFQLEQYASNFPFESIPNKDIEAIVATLDAFFSPTLKKVYQTIGFGCYFMTYPFFQLDITLSATRRISELLKSANVSNVPDRILSVGSALDTFDFFVDDYSLIDPIVHCLHSAEKRILASKPLSQVIRDLRGFPDCKKVPQEVFDYHWFIRHHQIPERHNAVEVSMQIFDWCLKGREGMEEKFKGHSEDSEFDRPPSGSLTEPDCYFSPFNFL